MKYIDQSGQGNTLLILTGAESRRMREFLEWLAANADPMGVENTRAGQVLTDFNRGIQRGTDKMTEESKAEFKARKK